MPDDNKTLVKIGGAVLSLLVVGILFKQWISSSSEEAMREEAVRAIEAASLAEGDGWSTDEEVENGQDGASGVQRRRGLAAGKGPGVAKGGQGEGGGSTGESGAMALRDRGVRRGSQPGQVAGGGIQAGGMPPVAAGGGGTKDLFKEARERVASRSRGSAPAVLPVPDKMADAVVDPNAGEPSETPALSILGKEEQARDDAAVANASTATYEAGEGHVFDTNSEVRIPNAGNITGESGTIAFELKPKWSTENGETSDAALFDLRTPNQWNNRMELVKNGPYLRFLMWDDEGNENGVSFQVKNWQDGEAHPVAVSWGPDENGQNVMSLIVDGAVVAQRPYQNPFKVPSNQPLVIGNNAGGALGANSVLNGFQAYNTRLPPSSVSSLSFGGKK